MRVCEICMILDEPLAFIVNVLDPGEVRGLNLTDTDRDDWL